MGKFHPALLSLLIPLVACQETPGNQTSQPLPSPSRVSTPTPSPSDITPSAAPTASNSNPASSPSPEATPSASPSDSASVSPSPTPSPTPFPEQLTVRDYPQDNSNSPYKELGNGKGDKFMFWAATNADNVLIPSQARFSSALSSSNSVLRVFYSKEGAIERIQNEKSGDFLIVEANDDAFTVKVYEDNGKFVSGYRITLNSGKYFGAQLLGRPYFTGQINLDLSGGSKPASVLLLPEKDSSLGVATELPGPLQDFLNRSNLLPGAFRTQAVVSGTDFASGLSRSNLGNGLALAGLLAPKLSSSLLSTSGATLAGPLLEAALVAASAWHTVNMINGSPSLQSDTNARFEANKSLPDIVREQLDLINSAGEFTYSKNSIPTLPGKLAGTLSPKADVTKLKIAEALPYSPTRVSGFLLDQDGLIVELSGNVTSTGLLQISGNTNGNDFNIANSSANHLSDGSFTGYAGSGTYTGQANPLGTCYETQNASLQRTFLKAHNLNTGTNINAVGAGTTLFSYDPLTTPDQFNVFSREGRKFSTSSLISVANTANISVPKDWIVIVGVNSNTSGSPWKYELSCPLASPTPSPSPTPLPQTVLTADHVVSPNISVASLESLTFIYTDGTVETGIDVPTPTANTPAALATALNSLIQNGSFTITERQSGGGAGNGILEVGDRLNIGLSTGSTRGGRFIVNVSLNSDGIFAAPVLNMIGYNIGVS